MARVTSDPKLKTDTIRRIYIGDVPLIYDTTEPDFLHKVTCNSQRCFLRSNPCVQPHPTEVIPVSVRRQSTLHGEGHTMETFPNNFVKTSRYTLWNFLPKNLYEQFRRVVNFYFLMITLVHSIIDGPIHPITAVSPLTFVIFVTAIKQGYEDWLRHKNDEQVNNRPVKVIRGGVLREIKSKHIQVGDVIKLEGDEQVPTDVLLLGSSDEFLRCQINTANLDGETDLKLRYCPSGLPHFKSVEDLKHLHVIVECEQPCEDLYEFNGSLLIPASKLQEMHFSSSASFAILDENDKNSEAIPPHEYFHDVMSGIVRQGMTDFLAIAISMDNLVLRGTRVKNTDFIFGLVIYTGKDTRLAKNSEKSQSKFSTVEKAVNYYLVFFIILLAFLVGFSCIMHYTVDWYPTVDGGLPWYTDDGKTSEGVGGIFTTIASFLILYNYIIPISLYVTIELQKFLGSKFFMWDQDMVDDEGREPLCNTSDLNEELGQIEYLFSDKTGTLTQNVMQFRHCSIASIRYEYRTDNKLYQADPEHQKSTDHELVNVLGSEKVLFFFKTLALCHSVQVVVKRRASFDHTPTIRESVREMLPFMPMEFQASSPDEKALLESCEQLGIIYRGEKEDVLTLDIDGNTEKYKRLMHLEFDAVRKCMSVIVENDKGEKWLLTKGAESSIIPKCDAGPTHQTLKHVMDYALMGLRTLVVAVRKLSEDEYEQFNTDIRGARRLIKNRQAKVRELYSKIEAHMTLLGATGVEDQLQDFVPETIQSFAAAGIRVWMLTGDKLETGVNVAVACGLITASTKQYILSKSPENINVRRRLSELREEMDNSDNTCFVIDGDSLAQAFKECPDILRDVAMKAFRVVCCRMAPLQKAQVVQMVKKSPKKPTCCAVGDGANDCAMILAAHVGIGILGKEGRQAARCADFAIAKFGHLRKAVLVHGHWYYVRLANLANYFFYKNVVFVMPQVFFAFHSNFSTQALFSGLFLMNYNIFFVSCPIFYYSLLEQPYSADTLLNNPQLYKLNKRNELMTVRKFLPWLITAFWHSAVVYYLPYFAWSSFDDIDNLMSYGTVIFTALVIVTNFKMVVETKFVTGWAFGAHLYSYATYFLIAAVSSEADLSFIELDAGDFRHVFFSCLSSVRFWLLMLLSLVVGMIPDISFAFVREAWNRMPLRKSKL